MCGMEQQGEGADLLGPWPRRRGGGEGEMRRACTTCADQTESDIRKTPLRLYILGRLRCCGRCDIRFPRCRGNRTRGNWDGRD